MREILFRGKGNRKYNSGDWYHGYLSKDCDGDYVITEIGFSRTVIAETVGQYTGLTDKNGKRIFEGDICEYDGYIGVVEFDTDDSMFTFTYDENIETNFGCLFGAELEVIGNVFDNSELLKGFKNG